MLVAVVAAMTRTTLMGSNVPAGTAVNTTVVVGAPLNRTERSPPPPTHTALDASTVASLGVTAAADVAGAVLASAVICASCLASVAAPVGALPEVVSTLPSVSTRTGTTTPSARFPTRRVARSKRILSPLASSNSMAMPAYLRRLTFKASVIVRAAEILPGRSGRADRGGQSPSRLSPP